MARKQTILRLCLILPTVFVLAACGDNSQAPITSDGDTSENEQESVTCSGSCLDVLPASCQSGKLCSCQNGQWTLTDCTTDCLSQGGTHPGCAKDELGNAICTCEGLGPDGDESEAAEELEAEEAEAESEADDDSIDVFDFDGTSVEGLPAAVCHAGTRWTNGTKAFKDATEAWGLAGIGARGVRLSAVDFDNDGWPDLLVRLNANADDFSDPTKRTTYLLRNKGDGSFEDVTESSGIRQTRVVTAGSKIGRGGEVFAFGDFNNDGLLDVYTGKSSDTTSGETSEILINNGNGTFSLGSATSPLRRKGLPDAPSGASFTDFDRDGNLDLWVSNGLYNNDTLNEVLYKGDGQGGFTDVTADLGLLTTPWSQVTVLFTINGAKANVNGWSANACDLNNDGYPELLAASYGRAPNHLFVAQGADKNYGYLNTSVYSGYAFDDRKDWTTDQSARCYCKLHPTATGCAGVSTDLSIRCQSDDDAARWDNDTGRETFRLGGNSAATICADINNDGFQDLITSEIVHWDVGTSSDPAELLVNTQDPKVKFTRPGNDVTGLARSHSSADWNEGIMSGSAFDFDNDGLLDIYWGDSDYPGSYGRLFHQKTDGTFEAVPIDLGIDMHRAHGVAVADFNRDGALDVVVGHSSARCNVGNDCYPTQQVKLFENVMGATGNALELKLIGGAGSNRSAIGARILLKAGASHQMREVNGGYGHYGAQNDLVQHFGLGTACEAEVQIRWPNAALTTESYTLPAGYLFTIEQGKKPVMTEKLAIGSK